MIIGKFFDFFSKKHCGLKNYSDICNAKQIITRATEICCPLFKWLFLCHDCRYFIETAVFNPILF